ncbi:MAG: sulfatase [Aggregatilineales bacterium]
MPQQEHPNLVFVIADQLRYQACGYSGETRARTPNIDRLATEGINFENAVTVSPVCGPTRACLFTGKYPTSTGFFRNDIRCMPDPDAIGHILTQAGYQTAYIGKWHLYGRESDEQYIPPGKYRLGFDDFWASYAWNDDYYSSFYYRDSDAREVMDGFQSDYLTTMGLHYLEQRDKTRPFALFLSTDVPHPPLMRDNAPPDHYANFEQMDFSDLLYATDELFEQFTPAFDRQWQYDHIIAPHHEQCCAYYAMISNVDDNVGRLLAYLDEHQLSENTIFVFTSDHGEMLGAHGRGNKRIFYEESIRVPFLLRWTDHIKSDTLTDVFMNTPDIAPTLIDLLNLSVPIGMEGFNYAPFIRGEIGGEDIPQFAFMQMLQCQKLNHHEEWRGIRDGDFLYARLLRNGKEFLFNHKDDPQEMNNLVNEQEHQAALLHYRTLLEGSATKLNDEMHLPEWYEAHWLEDGCVVRSATRQLDE